MFYKKLISLHEKIIYTEEEIAKKIDILLSHYANFKKESSYINKTNERIDRMKKTLTNENMRVLIETNAYATLLSFAKLDAKKFTRLMGLFCAKTAENMMKNLKTVNNYVHNTLYFDRVDLYSTLYSLKNNPGKAITEQYLTDKYTFELTKMVSDYGKKLIFHVPAYSSILATRNFLKNTWLQPNQYEIHLEGEYQKGEDENDLRNIQAEFPGVKVCWGEKQDTDNKVVHISFSDRPFVQKSEKYIILPTSDFKYQIPEALSLDPQTISIGRKNLGITENQKLLVVPSVTPEIAEKLIEIYQAQLLPENTKIILLPRIQDDKIEQIAKQLNSILIADKETTFTSEIDIIVSNTRGLAGDYQKIADAVIMPEDRNGWEALPYTPTIAEKGSWYLNPVVKDAINHGGGLWMEKDSKVLSEQIKKCFNSPDLFMNSVEQSLDKLAYYRQQAITRAGLLILSVLED